MMRKTLNERRVEKPAQINALKQELAHFENKAAERIGKIAMRAGLGDLDLKDETLLKEFQAIAGRFQSSRKESDS